MKIFRLLGAFTLICFAALSTAQAVTPAPDGGYAGHNTAEGANALFSLTTGNLNSAVGDAALFHDTTGTANTAMGAAALFTNTLGSNNTATGAFALYNTTGNNNTATGHNALTANTSGGNNTATGHNALVANTTGNNNTANGRDALGRINGSNNIALGFGAGYIRTTGSNNIDIGNVGVPAEANTIRIGNVVATVYPDGTTHAAHFATYIAGIFGKTSPGGVSVFINGAGQLGTATSSKRFKDEIKRMDKVSEAILALKPVTFRYKHDIDPERQPQFGLVAEDVEKVNPDLVVRDADGKPYTVRYEAVNAMLLNEFLKEHRKVAEQAATITQLKAELQATSTRQEKQIEALTAGLQKVSAQLELSKPAPQTALNNR